MSGYTHTRWYYQLVEKFRVYVQAKNCLISLIFRRYCTDMHSYSGHFGHAWLCKPKLIVSTCRKLWHLSACQKWTSSFPSFFRYYKILQFDWPTAFCSITWEPEFCQILDWWWNINSNIKLFPGKTNAKLFQKIQKPSLGPFWALYTKIWTKMNFLGNKGPVSFSIFKLSTTVQKIRTY